jgi:hypothetical protein
LVCNVALSAAVQNAGCRTVGEKRSASRSFRLCDMRLAVAGTAQAAEALGRRLVAAGAEVPEDELPRPSRAGEAVGDLAGALVGFERWLADDSSGLDAIVLADTSDAALAAALVAAKVPLAVVGATPLPTPGAVEAEGANTRLIAALVDASPGTDPAAILAAAREARNRLATRR